MQVFLFVILKETNIVSTTRGVKIPPTRFICGFTKLEDMIYLLIGLIRLNTLAPPLIRKAARAGTCQQRERQKIRRVTPKKPQIRRAIRSIHKRIQ